MRLTLSVAIITFNEEANLARTLASVAWADEVLIVDCGSTDHTAEIAARYNARFITEDWKGFGTQKNAALRQCTSDWVLSLDADEEVSPELAAEIQQLLLSEPEAVVCSISRRNLFLGRVIKHGGYYPDRKLRLLKQGAAWFEERAVHETLQFDGHAQALRGDLIHSAYPTLTQYLEHMNRYSTLGATLVSQKASPPVFLSGVLLNPLLTFFYNYVLRGGFLDKREGLLLHLYHSCYISWKYAKAWETRRLDRD